MLTFQDHFRQAGRWHRRQFLRAGGLALGEVRFMAGVPYRVSLTPFNRHTDENH